ncbi:MAG: hypothetical protein E7580_07110 [Ruminococcaceae bacterium]|nr:hypothetical protein [Oscillospiraceae bacterium]
MKKLFSVLLSLLAVLALTTGAFAEENPFIVDELDRLEDGVQAELNDRAKGLKETYGLDVYLAYVKGHADDAAPETIVGESTDYVLLLMGERGTRIYSGGKGDEIFSLPEDRDRLGYVHDEQDEWSDGVSRYLEVAEEYLKDAMPKEEPKPEADLKSEAEQNPAETKATVPEEEKSRLPMILIVGAGVVLVGIALFFIGKKRAWF